MNGQTKCAYNEILISHTKEGSSHTCYHMDEPCKDNVRGLPGGSVVKNPPASAGDTDCRIVGK